MCHEAQQHYTPQANASGSIRWKRVRQFQHFGVCVQASCFRGWWKHVVRGGLRITNSALWSHMIDRKNSAPAKENQNVAGAGDALRSIKENSRTASLWHPCCKSTWNRKREHHPVHTFTSQKYLQFHLPEPDTLPPTADPFWACLPSHDATRNSALWFETSKCFVWLIGSGQTLRFWSFKGTIHFFTSSSASLLHFTSVHFFALSSNTSSVHFSPFLHFFVYLTSSVWFLTSSSANTQYPSIKSNCTMRFIDGAETLCPAWQFLQNLSWKDFFKCWRKIDVKSLQILKKCAQEYFATRKQSVIFMKSCSTFWVIFNRMIPADSCGKTIRRFMWSHCRKIFSWSIVGFLQNESAIILRSSQTDFVMI